MRAQSLPTPRQGSARRVNESVQHPGGRDVSSIGEARSSRPVQVYSRDSTLVVLRGTLEWAWEWLHLGQGGNLEWSWDGLHWGLGVRNNTESKDRMSKHGPQW